MSPFEYLRDCIKTDIAPSPIHGIGTFALIDIKAGDELFQKWNGESRIYTITHNEFNSLPTHVKKMLLKSYENYLEEQPVVWFRLTKDCYWTMSNPLAYTNTAGDNGNFSSVTKVAKKSIRAGEELLGTYKLENTLL